MKLNQKGFAISTILYGLLLLGVLIMALLMNTASFNLMTTKDFVTTVEEDLDATANASLPGTDSWNITETYKKWEASKTGYYRITLCGAGSCTQGVIFLVVRQKLHFYKPTSGVVDVRLEKDDTSSRIMYAGGTNNNYISGGAGSKSPKNPKDSSYDASGKNITYHYSDKYFLNGIVTSGGGNSARIEFLGAGSKNVINIEDFKIPEVKNLSNIRFIMDCTDNTAYRDWSEIQVISGGKNIAYNKPITPNLGTVVDPNFKFITNNELTDKNTAVTNPANCVILDVGYDMDNNEFYNIEQIAVFASGNNHTVSVSTDDNAEGWINITSYGTPMGGGLNGKYYNLYNIP